MKKLLLVVMVFMFTVILSACGGLESAYPEQDADGNTTFTLEEVEAMIKDAIDEFEDELSDELNDEFDDMDDDIDNMYSLLIGVGAGNSYTKEEIDDLLWYIDWDIEDLYWAIDMNTDIMDILFEYILWVNDEATIVYEMSGEDYSDQFEKLKVYYLDYLIENHPDYFDETDRIDDTEYFSYTYEGWTINIEYDEYYHVIVVDSMEICTVDFDGVVLCEGVEVNQTNFVITVEELEEGIKEYLQELYNAN